MFFERLTSQTKAGVFYLLVFATSAFLSLAGATQSAQAQSAAAAPSLADINAGGMYADLSESTQAEGVYNFWMQNTYLCPGGKTLMADEVRTPQDIQAFVECAHDYMVEFGYDEAYRAFHNDPQWRAQSPNNLDGIYLFLDVNTQGYGGSRSIIYPPDKSEEGTPWGPLVASNGEDYFVDVFEVLKNSASRDHDSTERGGFVYYSWDAGHGKQGQKHKMSFVSKVQGDDVEGLQHRARGYVLGAGLVAKDTRGACAGNMTTAVDVYNAYNALNTDKAYMRYRPERRAQINQKLKEFVRCAALKYQSTGSMDFVNQIDPLSSDYRQSLTDGMRGGGSSWSEYYGHIQRWETSRWETLSIYLFVIDPENPMEAKSVFHPHRTDGLPDWADDWGYVNEDEEPDLQRYSPSLVLGSANVKGRFVTPDHSRDIISPAMSMGESFAYYRAYDPTMALSPPARPPRKISFLKRVVVQGKPLLIGAGYYLPDTASQANSHDCGTSNAPSVRRFVSASAVKTRDDVRAFVEQGRCFAAEYGLEAAREEFRKPIWFDADKDVYLFVEDAEKSSGLNTRVHVFPNDTSKEGYTWGEEFKDEWNNHYYPEAWRLLRHFDLAYSYWTIKPPEANGQNKKVGFLSLFTYADQKYTIGLGVYETGLLNVEGRKKQVTWPAESDHHPWSCDPSAPSQPMALATSDHKQSLSQRLTALQAFVSCVSYDVAQKTKAEMLTALKTWDTGGLRSVFRKSGPGTYIMALDAEGQLVWRSGKASASGTPHKAEWEGMGPRDSDVRKVADAFGEAFIYYTRAEANQHDEDEDDHDDEARGPSANGDRIAFLKRVQLADGSIYYIGAGLQ